MNIQSNTAAPPPSVPRETAPAQARSTPAPAVQGARTPAAPPSDASVKQAARQINEFLKSSKADVEFSVDSSSKHVVVRIVDAQTKEVIRQMPSEETIAISKSLDQMGGLLIQQKA
jgi:flagellar protein FlaG